MLEYREPQTNAFECGERAIDETQRWATTKSIMSAFQPSKLSRLAYGSRDFQVAKLGITLR